MVDPTGPLDVLPVNDGAREYPVPTAWRPVFRQIVASFVRHDYGLSSGIPAVEPVSAKTADHIRSYVEDYGEALVELPEETWNTSVASWQEGFWEVLVDLWTEREGCSDLVLHARVRESGDNFSFAVHLVYVP